MPDGGIDPQVLDTHSVLQLEVMSAVVSLEWC